MNYPFKACLREYHLKYLDNISGKHSERLVNSSALDSTARILVHRNEFDFLRSALTIQIGIFETHS